MGTRPPATIDLNGFAVPLGGSVVHFYYNPMERRRFVSFLLDGLALKEGVVFACTREGYDEIGPALELVGLGSPSAGLVRVEISPDLRAGISSIAHAARIALRNRSRGRLMADFGRMVGKESIFELEASLATSLAGLNMVNVLQYDGNNFDASVTIEQFRTHVLCIMGNAFYHENRDFTAADSYYRRRAAGSRK